MNIQNLNPDEQKQLQELLDKMNSPTEEVIIDPVNDLIYNIIDNFNFGKVQTVMFKLNWRWATESGGLDIPTIAELQKCATDLLRKAAKGTMQSKENGYHPGIGYTVGTGGFQATAYTDDDVTEVVLLDLKFILAEWDAEIEEK
jgi:hypothetical protein